MTFPAALPHGPLTRVADGVYAVRGGFPMGPGVTISRTMTVLQADDGLVVLNAMRLSEAGQAELDGLGRVKHLVHLSDSHGYDEPFYADRYAPVVWAPAGSKSSKIHATRTLGPDSPVTGGVVANFPGTSGWRECALWVPNGGGTLITCDALQNHVDLEGASFLARLITPLLGFKGGLIVASMWRKSQKVAGTQVRDALAEVSRLSFQNLVTGHGPAVVGGADAAARAAIERACT